MLGRKYVRTYRRIKVKLNYPPQRGGHLKQLQLGLIDKVTDGGLVFYVQWQLLHAYKDEKICTIRYGYEFYILYYKHIFIR